MGYSKKRLRDSLVFAMFACVMFCSRILMQALPSIHLVGMLIVVITAVYGVRALIPLYLYVFIEGINSGFATWWIPYLYVWTVLWALAMLIPRKLPSKWQTALYTSVCALHGLFFGVLYAPGQALLYGFNWEQTLAWVASGFYFDIAHFFGNLAAGLLIMPLVSVLRKMNESRQ